MSNPHNGHAASFFKQGSVIKCLVDTYNLPKLIDVVNSLQPGDEFVLFERTQKAKEDSKQRNGTPIEKQPTHNLTRVPAADAKANKEAWLAKNPRKRDIGPTYGL